MKLSEYRDKLDSITFKQVKQFLLKQSDANVYGDDPSACWTFGAYALHIFDHNIDIDDFDKFTELKEYKQLDQFNGAYLFSIDIDVEFHYAVLLFDSAEKRLNLYSTYGGYPYYIKKEFDLFDWLNNWSEFCNTGSIKNYKYIFNLGYQGPKKDKVLINDVRFIKL